MVPVVRRPVIVRCLVLTVLAVALLKPAMLSADAVVSTYPAPAPLTNWDGAKPPIAIDSATNTAYFANYRQGVTKFSGATRVATVIDLGPSALPGGRHLEIPSSVAINETTGKVYVTSFIAYTPTAFAVIDGATGTVTPVPHYDFAFLLSAVVNPVTNRVYAAANAQSKLLALNGATNTMLPDIPLGIGNPRQLAINTVTNKLYVVYNVNSTDKVSIVDLATNAVTHVSVQRTVGGSPTGRVVGGLAVDESLNKIYVAAQDSCTSFCSAYVAVIDGATNAVSHIQLPSYGSGQYAGLRYPEEVGVNGATHQVYVDLPNGNEIGVINGSTNTYVTSVGYQGCTTSLRVNAANNTIWAASRCGTEIVTMIDGATNGTTQFIISGPEALTDAAPNPVTGDVFVARSVFPSAISVISGLPGGAAPNTAPALTVPGGINTEATGPSGAVVTFDVTASDEEDDPEPVPACTPASGSTFPLGTTTVDCTVTDSDGADASASFDVTVHDTTSPSLTAPDTVTAEATSLQGAAVSFTATASDLVDGEVSVTCSPASGSTFPRGSTNVECSASDDAGNTVSRTIVVTVADTTAPSLAVPTQISVVAAAATGAVVTYAASASDAADPAPVLTCSPASGSAFPIGVTTATCTATDAAGNHSQASFTVSVTYNVCLRYDSNRLHRQGSTIPIKVQLCTATGENLSSPAIALQALSLALLTTTVTGAVEDAGQSNPDGNFRYDADLAGYVFNLQTKTLAQGEWEVRFTAGAAPGIGTARFKIR